MILWFYFQWFRAGVACQWPMGCTLPARIILLRLWLDPSCFLSWQQLPYQVLPMGACAPRSCNSGKSIWTSRCKVWSNNVKLSQSWRWGGCNSYNWSSAWLCFYWRNYSVLPLVF